jgi:hypothetical protein
MKLSTSLWLLKCLGLCLMGVLVLGYIGRTITPLISWSIYHNNPTPGLRNSFAMHYYLPLCVIYGLLLGLISLNRIREVFRSSLGIFSGRSLLESEGELDPKRPILWAWIPIAIVFLIRFVSWEPVDRSVFWTASHGRLEHFFSPPAPTSLNIFVPSARIWIFDRFAITGPTLFLLAYPLGVWLRHQIPSSSQKVDPLPSDHPH